MDSGAVTALMMGASSVLTVFFMKGVPMLMKWMKTTHEMDQEASASRQKQADAVAERDLRIRKEEREAIRQEVEFQLQHQNHLIDQYRTDLEAKRKENHDLRNEWGERMNEVQLKILQCETDRARQAERISSLEEALAREGIEVRKSDGSGPLPALPPQQPGTGRRKVARPKPPPPPPDEETTNE